MTSTEPLQPERAVELYLNDRESELRKETLRTHRHRLEGFVEWCREHEIVTVRDLDGRDLLDYKDWRGRGDGAHHGELAPATLHHHMQTLRVFLRFLEDIEAVSEGLSNRVRIPPLSEEDQVSDAALDVDEAHMILDWLDQYHYASRDHICFLVLWITGRRLGAVRGLDLQDFNPEEGWLRFQHRPDPEQRNDTHTPLKNGEKGEGYISLYGDVASTIQDYVAMNRHDVRDSRGREPLITTRNGRPAMKIIRQACYKVTQPCRWSRECPHDRSRDTCEWTQYHRYSECPSSLSPHAVRKGSLSAQLNGELHELQPGPAPIEAVGDRSDVTAKVLRKHYDVRGEREKMEEWRREIYGTESERRDR